MTTEQQPNVPEPVLTQFAAEIEKFRIETASRMLDGKGIMGYIQIASGLHPEDSITRYYPLASIPLEGHPADTFSAITISRDMIFALMALNDQYGLNIGDALQLAALAHPSCTIAMQNGQIEVQKRGSSGNVIRDIVDVGSTASSGS